MGDPKNAPTSHEANVKFLVACFMYMKESNRPDFAKIVEVLELPSTGAAAKRFERLMKNPAFGGNPDWSWTRYPLKAKSDKSDEGENGTPMSKKRKTPSTPGKTESNEVSKPKRSKTNSAKTEVKNEESLEIIDGISNCEAGDSS